MRYIKLSFIASLARLKTGVLILFLMSLWGCAAQWQPVDPAQPLSAQEIRQQHKQNRQDAYILTAIAAVTSFFIVQSAD